MEIVPRRLVSVLYGSTRSAVNHHMLAAGLGAFVFALRINVPLVSLPVRDRMSQTAKLISRMDTGLDIVRV